SYLFLYHDPLATYISPLSLHDALPISYVAQVDRQGCALILADTWPEKIGNGLMFISLNVEPETREAAIAALDALRAELEAKGVRSEEHTSELQSPYDLVCRLLLEKKKK